MKEYKIKIENNHFFKRECEREKNKKFIENNMRRKKVF